MLENDIELNKMNMKTHTSLEDLFCDNEYITKLRRTLSNAEWRRCVKEWSQNKLALGKPEPLEKNKQAENSFKCDACPETFKTLPDLVEHVKGCDFERYI